MLHEAPLLVADIVRTGVGVHPLHKRPHLLLVVVVVNQRTGARRLVLLHARLHIDVLEDGVALRQEMLEHRQLAAKAERHNEIGGRGCAELEAVCDHAGRPVVLEHQLLQDLFLPRHLELVDQHRHSAKVDAERSRGQLLRRELDPVLRTGAEAVGTGVRLREHLVTHEIQDHEATRPKHESQALWLAQQDRRLEHQVPGDVHFPCVAQLLVDEPEALDVVALDSVDPNVCAPRIHLWPHPLEHVQVPVAGRLVGRWDAEPRQCTLFLDQLDAVEVAPFRRALQGAGALAGPHVCVEVAERFATPRKRLAHL